MVTHSSILAWEVPWTEEPCGLRSMGHKESDMTKVTYHAHWHSSGGMKTETRVPAGLVSGMGSPSGLESPSLEFMWSFLGMCTVERSHFLFLKSH